MSSYFFQKNKLRTAFAMILFIFITLGFSSCNKEEIEILDHIDYKYAKDIQFNCPVKSVKGSKKSIVGKWKLVKEYGGLRMEGPLDEDYSCNSIIFHFRSNGKLEIESDIDYYQSGTFNYTFKTSPKDHNVYERYTLKTGEFSEHACEIQDDGRVMILNNSYLDGTIRYFIRIM